MEQERSDPMKQIEPDQPGFPVDPAAGREQERLQR